MIGLSAPPEARAITSCTGRPQNAPMLDALSEGFLLAELGYELRAVLEYELRDLSDGIAFNCVVAVRPEGTAGMHRDVRPSCDHHLERLLAGRHARQGVKHADCSGCRT